MAFVLSLMLFVIEMFGTIIKAGVLAIRLFANMFAGHMALSLLELFVAFLQAYVFTFLTALFMGMSLHPQH